MKEEQIRTFIAIELSDELRESLAQIQAKLKSHLSSPVVKWVDPQGIHLTLKFLGNVPAGKVPQITEAIAEAAKSVAPFHLELSQLGAFPNLNMPRVAWVGLGGDVESLLRLQQGIEQALIPLGFTLEARGFSSHLTLGRVRDRATSQERHRLGEGMSSLQLQERLLFYVDKVSVMRSTLTSGGAIYSRLAFVGLALPTAPI